MIYPPAKELLEKLSKEQFLEDTKAMLIGGTAIAFYLKHRISYDIDITLPYHEILPPLDILKNYPNIKKLPLDTYIIEKAKDEGENIDNYYQRYSIDGVKVDFVSNLGKNIYESNLYKPNITTKYNKLNIAPLDTLFQIKSLLLLDRNRIRDLYDIVFMLKEKNFCGEDIFKTILEYRITYTKNSIYRYIEDKTPDILDIKSEGITNPKMDITSYQELKNYILTELEKYL